MSDIIKESFEELIGDKEKKENNPLEEKFFSEREE
jgi:hypothetical protein